MGLQEESFRLLTSMSPEARGGVLEILGLWLYEGVGSMKLWALHLCKLLAVAFQEGFAA